MTAAANATDPPTVKKVKPKPLDGDAQLRRIARAGRQWKMTMGRKVDMESESPLISLMHSGVVLTDGNLQHTCTDFASSGHDCGQMTVRR